MPEFRITVSDPHSPTEPYDGGEADALLGHIEMSGSSGTASSRGHEPRQWMMIVLSVASLLGGLAPVIESGRGSFGFQGAGSKFALKFKLKKNGPMVVKYGRTVIDESDPAVFAAALWAAAEPFGREYADRIPDGEMRDFFVTSLDAFREAVRKRAGGAAL